jgi:hypothetical protein
MIKPPCGDNVFSFDFELFIQSIVDISGNTKGKGEHEKTY